MPIQVNPSGNPDIDGVLWGSRWDFTNLLYSIPTTAGDYGGYGPITGFQAMNPAQVAAIHLVMANFDAVSGLTLTFTNTFGAGNIRFAEADTITYQPGGTAKQPGGGTAEGNVPSPEYLVHTQGDTWYSHSLYDNPALGNFAYTAGFLHEVGHAVGLKHGHEARTSPYNQNISFPALPTNHDSNEYSVMTYRRYVGDIPGQTQADFQGSDFPTTLMMDDIAALQYMYGADFNTNSGDTTYRWSPTTGQMSVNGVGQTAPFRNYIFMTLWDGGGVDTYDFSNYTTGVTADLRPGFHTTVSTAQLANVDGTDGNRVPRGNIFNALTFNGDLRSVIENVTGSSGADYLGGNGVNNLINGGLGADRMEGRAGNDTYVVENVNDVVIEIAGGGADTVFTYVSYSLAAASDVETLRTNSDAGTSAINLSGNALANTLVGNAGVNALNGGAGIDQMTGNGGNDIYYVDVAGDRVFEATGGGNDTVLASVSYALAAGQEIETLAPTNGAGTTAINFNGNEFANRLIGNAGANILSGGGGADQMAGNGGDDVFYVDAATDLVFEALNGGTDTVLTGVTYALAAGQQIETLTTSNVAGTGAINLTGNEIVNRLVGNAGANTIDGRGGADAMQGLGGNDIYFVDNAGDRVFEAAGGGNDRVATGVSYVLTAGQEIEVFTTNNAGSTSALDLTGNQFVNYIIGNAGANRLDGRGGADTMQGVGGADFYLVDNAGDVVLEAVGGGNDRVATGVSYVLTAGQEIEVFTTDNAGSTSALNLTGNGFGNYIIGNAGANTIDGKVGVDTMQGLGGNDLYHVDNAGDVVLEAVGGGNDRVAASVSYALTAGQQIEVFTTNNTAGAVAINLTGNAHNQTIAGNAGNNVLNGGAGNDILTGLGGNDSFVFNTALNPATNVDTITDFSVVDDTITLENAVFAGLAAGTLTANAFRIGAAAGDADDRIIYNNATGQLIFDSNGNAAGGATHFATLAAGLALTNADFVII